MTLLTSLLRDTHPLTPGGKPRRSRMESGAQKALRRYIDIGTSLVVQWVTLHAPNAGGPGLIPDRGTRPHMHASTESSHAATKIPRATTKTRSSQNNKINKY